MASWLAAAQWTLFPFNFEISTIVTALCEQVKYELSPSEVGRSQATVMEKNPNTSDAKKSAK